jgi:hypothetical protein
VGVQAALPTPQALRAQLAIGADGCDPRLRVLQVPDVEAEVVALLSLLGESIATWRVQPRFPAMAHSSSALRRRATRRHTRPRPAVALHMNRQKRRPQKRRRLPTIPVRWPPTGQVSVCELFFKTCEISSRGLGRVQRSTAGVASSRRISLWPDIGGERVVHSEPRV